MSGGAAVAVVLAVLGAGCFAGAAVLQHRAVGAVTGGAGLRVGGLAALLRRRSWLAGIALGVAGTALHAAALVLAPLSLVQPVGVLAVPLAVLLTAVRARRGPGPGVVAGIALAVGGVGVFVLVVAGAGRVGPVPPGAVAVAVAVAGAGMLALVGLRLLTRGWLRCVAAATAAAVGFGLVSVLVRAFAQAVRAGDLDAGAPGAALALLGALVSGAWLVQQAFASGPPEVVVACLTVVDPLVAVLLGVVLLGEAPAADPAALAVLVPAAAVAVAGVVALARHHPDARARTPGRASREPVLVPTPLPPRGPRP